MLKIVLFHVGEAPQQVIHREQKCRRYRQMQAEVTPIVQELMDADLHEASEMTADSRSSQV